MKLLLLKFFAFGVLGYLLEGVFNRVTMGAIVEKALKKPKKSFFTYSSPYMIPIFGLSAVLISLVYMVPFMQKIAALPILAIIGMIIIDSLELGGGLLLNKVFKLQIWDYSNDKFNLLGQIDRIHSLGWMALTIPICWTDSFISWLAK
jgi:uncharacterized membrane protein